MDFQLPEGQNAHGAPVLIVIGIIITSVTNFAEGLHLAMAIILQFTGLCTFITYLILNWSAIMKEYERFFGKGK